MNRFDCETIRDMLPSLMRGEMLPHEAARIEHHLADCDDCTAEAGIIRLLQSSLVPVPAGLETRVIHAVGSRRVGRRAPARLALAATIAAAVIGGTLFVQRPQDGDSATLDVDAVSWAAAEDPLLHGGTALQELSVAELEILLEELDQ